MTWLERIEAALQTGKFTQEDKGLSGEWATCAVSEGFDSHKYHLATSSPLVNLGVNFCTAVVQDQPEAAMLLWKEIQEKI